MLTLKDMEIELQFIGVVKRIADFRMEMDDEELRKNRKNSFHFQFKNFIFICMVKSGSERDVSDRVQSHKQEIVM